jgi:4-hydroxybenzoate polyprenyltransferase
MAALRDYAELVRLPAAATVLGDSLTGAAAAGRTGARANLGLPVASVLLYWGGMALNDAADARLDAVERPERPIPSGRIGRRRALAVASALTVAGLGAAALAGGRSSVAVAVPLAASIWTYDLVAKQGPAGPIAMAACRGLDVLLGAGADGVRAAAGPAALVAFHTASLTTLSRGEVHGTRSSTALASASATVLTAGAVVGRLGGGADGGVGVLGAIRYLWPLLRAQGNAVGAPDAGTVRGATREGIFAMIPLQAALIAGSGRPITSVALLTLHGLVRRRGRPARSGGGVT